MGFVQSVIFVKFLSGIIMDAYIRNFNVKKIATNIVNNIHEYNNITSCMNKINNIKIIHNNIRSISKNFDEFAVLLREFESKFDIIILTETHEVSNINLYKLSGYDTLYNEGTLNQNDGLIVYIRSSIQYKYKICELNNIKYKNSSTKINFLNLDIVDDDKQNLSISAIYRSPSTCPYSFNREIEKYLSENQKNVCTHVIVGDINIDLSSNEDYVQEYLNILGEYRFSSYINEYTRVFNNQKSIIDHFFVYSKTQSDNIIPIIYRTLVSDHYPIIMHLGNLGTQEKNSSSSYSKKYIDYRKLKLNLQNEEWCDVYENNCLHTATEIFIRKLKLYTENSTIILQLKNHQKPKKDWITIGLVKSINTKNEMYKKVIDNPEDENLTREYKNYKNKLTSLIKKVKLNYYKNLINKNKNSNQDLWQTVNDICSKNKAHIKIENLQIEDNFIDNKQEIANKFNQYYSTVGEVYANKIKCDNNTKFSCTISKNSIFLRSTDEQEIKKCILELKTRKAPGIDNIKSETLKEISDEIILPLKYLINNSLELGIFPDILKTGIVKPLFKYGNKNKMENYRPITLISNIAKIFEKIIKERIIHFLNRFNLLSDKQFGFRTGKSTQDAIAYLIKLIYKKIDESKPALCIFIDLAKAFDTVCHQKLIEKLQNIGFRGNALNLMRSYLSDRVQYVQIDEKASHPMKISYGVPQGTVLGPVLFIIYINNLLNLESTGKILSFADDTAIFYSANTWSELKNKAEIDFKNIKRWFDFNKLTLNCEKTKYLPFASYSTGLPNMGNLSIDNNSSIKEGEFSKYLGIIIDKHLRWDLHIKHLINKIRYLLATFKCLKQFLDINQMKIIYHSLIESQITYGQIGWGGVAQNHIKNLEVLQKRFLKIIVNKKATYPSNALFSECKLLDIRQLYSLSILVYLQKNKSLIKYNFHIYDTRNKNIITEKSKNNKRIGQKCYTYLGPSLYDKIPIEIRSINNIHLFKKRTRNWLLNFDRETLHNIITK